MNAGVIGVFELLGYKHAGVFGLHLFDLFNGSGNIFVGGCENQVGAEGFDEFFAFDAHVFRHDNADLVSHQSAYEGNADAGIAGGGFDDDRIGLEFAAALGPFEHGQGYPVFDAAAWVEKLSFGVNGLASKLNEGCVAN